jgi:hypothetical protein
MIKSAQNEGYLNDIVGFVPSLSAQATKKVVVKTGSDRPQPTMCEKLYSRPIFPPDSAKV